MLFGALRVDESTKSNTLSSISLAPEGYWQMGFKTCRFTSWCCPNNYLYWLIIQKIQKNFQKNFLFCSVSFFEKSRNLVFGTRLVPTLTERKLAGSTSSSSAVTMQFTNSALFSVSKNIDISKIRDLWGDQNITIFILKTGLFNMFLTENGIEKLIQK